MAIQTRGKAVHAANLGLYLDRPPLLVPERGLITGENFRITNGQITNLNVGWQEFEGGVNLDGKPVLLIEQFQPAGGVRKTIFGNTTDLFQYLNGDLSYITPRHDSSGETVDVTNGSATVTGNSTTWVTDGIKSGDFIAISTDETDPAADWFEVLSVDSETQLTLTANYTGSTASTEAYTIRKTFTSSILEPYATEVFRNGTDHTVGSDGDRWYATNGADPIVGWDGVTDQVYFSHSGVNTAKALRRFKNTLVLVAPTIAGALEGQTIMNSAIGQPENTSTLEAAQFIVYDGSDPLTAAHPIGELLAIYAERAIILAQFVGVPLMFVFRTAVSGYGVRSPRGVVLFPSHHTLFSSDGQYVFDGVALNPSSTHIWKEVTRRSTPSRAALVQGTIDEGNAEVLWVVPLNTDANVDDGPPERAYVGHYMEDSGDFPMPHSTRQLPATATGQFIQATTLTFDQMTEQFDEVSFRWDDQQIQAAFPQILFGTADGDVFQLNAQNQGAVVPTSFVRFSRRPLVDSRRRGVVKRIYPGVDFQAGGAGSITVNLRLIDAPNGDVQQQVEFDVPLDGSARFAPFRASARYAEVEFGTGPSVQGLWSLEGYDMDTVAGAER